MTREQAKMHLESSPRKFAKRDLTSTATRDKSNAAMERALKAAESMTKADALRVAQTILVHLKADGIGYEDFQSAQAVEKYVGKAIAALRGLS